MADDDLITDEQIKLLRKIEAVRKLRGAPGYKEIIDFLLSGLLEKEGLTIEDLEHFQIKQKSFAELLADCKLDVVNPMFNEAGWPLEPVEPYENEWELNDERVFENTVTIEQGLNLLGEMSTDGHVRCPNGSRQAMEWLAKNPDKQLDYPIILPVLQRNSTEKIVPIFMSRHEAGGKIKRLLVTGRLDTKVYSSCRWLILRKRTK